MESFNDTKLEGHEGEVNWDVSIIVQILIESFSGDKKILTNLKILFQVGVK